MDAGQNLINGIAGVAKGNMQLAALNQAGSDVSALSQYNPNRKPEDSKAALQQFEGLFIGQLLRLMYDTVPVNSEFGGGFAEETYRGMLIDEYGMNMAKTGGIGITDKLQKSLYDFQNIRNESGQIVTNASAAAESYRKIYNF